MNNDEARLLASARVVLRATAREYRGDDWRAGRIALSCECAEQAIHSALTSLDVYADSAAARRFGSATDQALIDSL